MKWQEVRQHHPHRWVLVEATQAHIEAERWLADELDVVDTYEDVSKAMSRYKHLHRKDPARDFFVAHTDNTELSITNRSWIGIRSNRSRAVIDLGSLECESRQSPLVRDSQMSDGT